MDQQPRSMVMKRIVNWKTACRFASMEGLWPLCTYPVCVRIKGPIRRRMMSTFTRRTLVSAVAAGGFGVLAKSDTQAAVLFGQSQEETIGRNSRCCSRTATSATYRTAKRMPTAATRRGRAGTASWRSAPARQWSAKRWRCLMRSTTQRRHGARPAHSSRSKVRVFVALRECHSVMPRFHILLATQKDTEP